MGNPWQDAPDLWADEQAYCQWLRSQGRRIWSRHPIKIRYIKAHKVPVNAVREEDRPTKLNPRTKELCKCEMCGCYTIGSNTEVDHISMAGSFTNVAEWHDWLDRLLLIGFDDIRLLCKPCHKKVNLSQRFHCSIEEAEIRQKLAAFKKLRIYDMKLTLTKLHIPYRDWAKKHECEEAYEQWVRSHTAV